MAEHELPFEAINDAAPVASPVASSGGELPFDAINDGAAEAPPDATMSSLAASPAIGFNRGLADVLGAPVDVTNWAMGKVGLPTSQTPFAGSEFFKKGLGVIGANPDTAQHAPRSQLEKILQASGEGAAGMVAPEALIGGMAASGVKMAPRVAEAADTLFGSGQTPAKNAIIGATAAGTGEAGAQQFPDNPNWAMAARTAGNLIGGGAGVAATETPALYGAARRFVAPMREADQPRLAGERLRSAIDNPNAAIDTLGDQPPLLNENADPNSGLTTFQLLGGTRLGALEREEAAKNPDLFMAKRGAQNKANVEALSGIQKTGTPEDVSAHLRSRLNDLDQQAGDVQNIAAQHAQTAAGALGGNQSPGFYGEAIHGEISPQVQAATEAAAGQVNALGGAGTPEGYGAALREPYHQATEALRQQRNRLYKAIDPDNSLNIVASPLRDASADLYASTSKMATPLSGEEAGIKSTIKEMPDVVPFNDLRALDSRITAAMSAERRAGETPVWGRLTQLKKAVAEAIDNGVANQVAYERDAVARGDIQPTDTLESRLAAERDQFLAQRAAVGDSEAGNGAGASGGPSGAAMPDGAVGQARRGLGADAGAEGLPPEELSPNFDPAAADRLAAAKQANVALQVNKKGPLGSIVRTDGFGNPKMPSSSVPDEVFTRGPGGFEKAVEYRRAVNDDPAAISAMQNYAAATLRKAAERPDGTLDPGKFSSWKAAHADAMRAFPELLQRFNTAAKASESLKRFAPFRADMAPSQIPEMFFHSGSSGAEGVANLRRLVGDAKANSILSDYAAAKLRSSAANADGTLDPGRVAAFQKAHAEALKAFPDLNAKFSTAAKAQQTVDAVAKARKQGLDTYQSGAIGKIMNAAPEDVKNHIGAIFGSKDATSQMERLAKEAASDKTGAATAGLRKGIADFINSKFISNTEAGTSETNLAKSDAFQTFMNQSRPALAKVFKPDEVASMDAIAARLHAMNRSITAVKLPGGSNTTQDTYALAKSAHAKPKPLLREVMEGAVAGHVAHGPVGAAIGVAGAVGQHVANAMRAAGYAKVDDLVRDALLNPELARTLLMKAPISSGRGSDISLAQQLRRLSVFSAAQQAAPPQFRAAGGRVEPTEAQKAVGNYKKHHMRVHGLDVTIENMRGSWREGVGRDGKKWRVKMPNHYGYIRGTTGADDDHVDCYVGPDESSDKVFVIDQKDIHTGKFDEHKTLLGFKDRDAAIGGYTKGFSDGNGAKRIQKITPMSVDEFKAWLASGKTREPIGKAA